MPMARMKRMSSAPVYSPSWSLCTPTREMDAWRKLKRSRTSWPFSALKWQCSAIVIAPRPKLASGIASGIRWQNTRIFGSVKKTKEMPTMSPW